VVDPGFVVDWWYWGTTNPPPSPNPPQNPRGRHSRAGHSSVRLEAVKFWVSGHGSCPGGPCFLQVPGALLSRWPPRACRYRRGSADAARSRATDPAATRADPAAILGLRRCTARAARRTLYTAFGASMAIASTVSRRGWRRRHGTPMTIHATGETSSSPRKNRDIRRAVGVSVPAGAEACVPGLRIRSICCRKFSCTSAAVGASVPRPHAISPKPAAPAHSPRARCRRPAAQCPAPAAAWVTTGATACSHPDVREGLDPSRWSIRVHR
jgi:hypothetical protein